MNKKLFFLIFAGMLALAVCPFGFVSALSSGYQLHDYSNGSTLNLRDLMISIENVVALVFSAIAVVMFVVAGVLFLTARGEAEQITKAKSAVIWGVAGVVVGIVAFSIIRIVVSFI